MFRKIVDVLKEVFWIKPSRKSSKSTRSKKAKKAVVKKKKGTVPKMGTASSPTVKKKIAKPKGTVPKTGTARLPNKVAVAKKAPKSAIKPIDPSLTEVGIITHYFERIKVCVVNLTNGTVLIGDKLTIIGPKTKFIQKVWSMQVESVDVKVAKKGQLIGLKVDKLVAVGDKVYK